MRWDPGISNLRVTRVVSAIDVGRAINALTSRNQVEGAIVMGIGMARFEQTDYDHRDARPVNNNYAEYLELYVTERIIPEMDRPRISSRRLLPDAIKRRLGITEDAIRFDDFAEQRLTA